jgi:hypothetical protein
VPTVDAQRQLHLFIKEYTHLDALLLHRDNQNQKKNVLNVEIKEGRLE